MRWGGAKCSCRFDHLRTRLMLRFDSLALRLHTRVMLRSGYLRLHLRTCVMLCSGYLHMRLRTCVMLRCGYLLFLSFSFLHSFPGLFREPGLCLVFSNLALRLLISRVVLRVQLSKRWPALPQPRHLRAMKVFPQILLIEHDQLDLSFKCVMT